MKASQNRDFASEANRVRDSFLRKKISFAEAFNATFKISAEAASCGYSRLSGERVARILLNRQVGFDKFIVKKPEVKHAYPK